MDFFNVAGLPLHVLLVHFVVVLVPLTALSLIVISVWPAARRRLGLVTALLGVTVIGLVPLTMAAGEWLMERVAVTPLVDTHVGFGSFLWPWSLSVGVLSIVTWLWYFLLDRRARGRQLSVGARRTAGIVIAVLAVVVGTGAIVQTVLTGDSGSRAVWQGNFSTTPPRSTGE